MNLGTLKTYSATLKVRVHHNVHCVRDKVWWDVNEQKANNNLISLVVVEQQKYSDNQYIYTTSCWVYDHTVYVKNKYLQIMPILTATCTVHAENM